MIYQPRNVQPSSTSIDATHSNEFSMEIQTNTSVVGYQLIALDFDNNEIYVGIKQILTTPKYNGDKLFIDVNGIFTNGNDYKWRVRLFQDNSDMLMAYGFVQQESTETHIFIQPNINVKEDMTIKIGNETKTITSYDVDTGELVVDQGFLNPPAIGTKYYIYSNFIETVPDYIVYARALPEVEIIDIPEIITSKYHTFLGTYQQEQNVPMIYHIFDLYILNDDGTKELIDTSGKIYSANLTYTYNAFRTGNIYYLKMTIENDMGIIAETDFNEFEVRYDIVEYLQQPIATLDSNQNAVRVSWVAPVEHDAKVISTKGSGDVGFTYLYDTPYNTVNSLYTKDYIAEWESDDGLYVIPENHNITLQFSPDENFYYDENGYVPVVPIIETESESDINENSFSIYLDTYILVYLRPHIENDALSIVKVVEPPEGDSNTGNHIYIDKDIDISLFPYITFRGQEYVEKILSYDADKKMITMQRELPFIPQVGDEILLNDYLSKDLYSGMVNAFVLTTTGTSQINEDYIWMDNAVWDDDYIWTEGGTSIERVCNHWWKVQITDNEIKTEEIYASV